MKQSALFGEVEKHYTANCDGGCRGNPGVGAIGVTVKNELTGEELEFAEAELLTTNNQQELKAVIKALSSVPPGSKVTIRTDSRYVTDGIEKWLPGWKRSGWTKSNGEPVKNVELWKILDALRQKHTVTWTWVRGHNGDPGNTKADKLANAAMDAFIKKMKA